MSEESNSNDPVNQMIQFYEAFSKSWSNVMSEAVGSKQFAEAVGQQMQTNLEAFAQMQRQTSGMMEQYLQQANLPSRKEFSTLLERITRLELSLDDLDAKLDRVLDLLEKPKPRRSGPKTV